MVAKGTRKQAENTQDANGENTVTETPEVLPESITNQYAGEVTEKDPARTGIFRHEQLASVESFEDALALLGGSENVLDASELGTGFDLVKDKDTLVGVPMLLMQWKFSEGNHGEFVIVYAVTKQNQKVVFVDGSTGIYRDLKTLYETEGRLSGLLAKNGLNKSEYEFTDEKGNKRPAITYYVSS